jgi:hypothetical protein
MRAFSLRSISLKRELLIKIPINTVSMVGTDASAIDRIWLSLISTFKVAEMEDFSHGVDAN